ncbi:hypothetical protein [Streptomyces sp. WMMB303]|uniref:hypothetical protein n=1 Tax=Streptomyces sp. WMMB303 TaxID=3034154 RepID=UPI0023EE08DD|nr:hypothetical protein [Streptomyces sp. WMMB303]MDF4250440.1 hypothetical protein [Streptomyces sp. WMMB303]
MFGRKRAAGSEEPIEVGATYDDRRYGHRKVTVTGTRQRDGETVIDYEVHRPWGSEGREAATESVFREDYRG